MAVTQGHEETWRERWRVNWTTWTLGEWVDAPGRKQQVFLKVRSEKKIHRCRVNALAFMS